MLENQTLVNRYLRYYQRGGSAPDVGVFKGMRRWDVHGPFHGQTGGGPDKVGSGPAKGIMRAVAPLLAHGVSKFLIDTATDFSKGDDLGDAAKNAIVPAILNAVSAGGYAQAGKGRRRRGAKRQQRGRGGKAKSTRKRSSNKHKRVLRKPVSALDFVGMGIKTSARKPKKSKKAKKARKTKLAKHSLSSVNF